MGLSSAAKAGEERKEYHDRNNLRHKLHNLVNYRFDNLRVVHDFEDQKNASCQEATQEQYGDDEFC